MAKKYKMGPWRRIGTEPLEQGILATDGKLVASCYIWERKKDGARFVSPHGSGGHDCESEMEYMFLVGWMPLPLLPTREP